MIDGETGIVFGFNPIDKTVTAALNVSETHMLEAGLQDGGSDV